MTTKTRSKLRSPKPLENAGGLLCHGWSDEEVFAAFSEREAQADKGRIDALCSER